MLQLHADFLPRKRDFQPRLNGVWRLEKRTPQGGCGAPPFLVLEGPPTGTLETPVFAEGDCLRGISLRQEVKCRDWKDQTLMEAAKKGGILRAAGVQRGSRGRLSSLPHSRELSSVCIQSPVT